MTLSEFKAWFEGYTEGLKGAPTKAQFDRIKEKVKEIDGAPVTERIFIDRYWPQVVRPWSPPYYTWIGATSGTYAGASGYATSASNNIDYAKAGYAGAEFNSAAAMYAVGKAEALA